MGGRTGRRTSASTSMTACCPRAIANPVGFSASRLERGDEAARIIGHDAVGAERDEAARDLGIVDGPEVDGEAERLHARDDPRAPERDRQLRALGAAAKG